MNDTWQRVVVFVDIRGFTKLAQDVDLYQKFPEFLYRFFHDLVRSVQAAGFADESFGIKPLGDGAMIVLPGSEKPGAALQQVFRFIHDFDKKKVPQAVKAFRRTYGVHFKLHLGWGISRGQVTPLNWQGFRTSSPAFRSTLEKVFPHGFQDYFGPILNRTARLCDAARPHGIVVDAERFSTLPPSRSRFVKQTLELKGIGPLAVYVTPEIAAEIAASKGSKAQQLLDLVAEASGRRSIFRAGAGSRSGKAAKHPKPPRSSNPRAITRRGKARP
jgi:class 3 adenylate cyclase